MSDTGEKMNLDLLEDEKEKNSIDPDRMGCKHYARKCSFITPCCKKEYACRVCHNDGEQHEVDRRSISEIKCLTCNKQQKVQKACEQCLTVFGKYFCEKCRLFDDEEKGQFHCDPCGLCRVGGRDKFFHCKRCDMCLSVKLEGHHKCVDESSRRNCAVCLDDLHTSRTDAHMPPCGHLIHRSCFDQCLKTGNYTCPTCNVSLLDMGSIWKQLDSEVAGTEMPEDYRNYYVNVLCRDCHKESRVLFHVLGLKCQACGSYNTCRSGETTDNQSTPQGNAVSDNVTGQIQNTDTPPEGATGVSSPETNRDT